MSHPEQHAFFQLVADRNPSLVEGGRILEIGAYDVNGTVRALFGPAREYIGVDLQSGPGVDVIGFGHEHDEPDAAYDLTLSGECFEHDPHWRATIANMVRLTRPGGLVAFTCASRGRPEHGTRRTLAGESPGTQAVGLDYYRNLEPQDFEDLPLDSWFDEAAFWYMPTSFDLYFAGIRAGGTMGAQLPHDSDVEAIRHLMALPHRMVRWPLRGLATVIKDEQLYQRIALPYWKAVLRAGGAAGRRFPQLKRNSPGPVREPR